MIKELATILRGARARQAPFSVLSEAVWMRFSSQRLQFSDYICYRFHEGNEFSPEERKRFLGDGRAWKLADVCNERKWLMLGEKLAFAHYMLPTGLRTPEIRAVYDRAGRTMFGAASLKSEREVLEYLREPEHYPLFAKWNLGVEGDGAFGLKSYAPDTDTLELLSGDKRPLTAWVGALEPDTRRGILFQEMLRPHAEVARICGPRLCGLRICLGRIRGEIHVLSALWKITTGKNMMDNYRHGGSGNLIGGIDLETGRITRVITLIDRKVSPVASHPDTGAPFAGFALPDWQEAVSVCKKAAGYVSGGDLQHWDVALTDLGPTIIELNLYGAIDFHQHANGRGFWSEQIEEIRRHAYPRYWASLDPRQRIWVAIMHKIDRFQ